MKKRTIYANFVLVILLLIGLLIFALGANGTVTKLAVQNSTLKPMGIFGYSTGLYDQGDFSNPNSPEAQRVQMGSDTGAQVTSISFHVRSSSSSHVVCALYTDSSGLPNALLGITSIETVGSTISWVTFPFSTPINVNANAYYWIAWISDNGVLYTTQGGTGMLDGLNYGSVYPNFANPFGNLAESWPSVTTNIYATYTTPSSSPTPTPTPSGSPTPIPSVTPTPTPTGNPTPTPSGSASPTPSGSSTPTPPATTSAARMDTVFMVTGLSTAALAVLGFIPVNGLLKAKRH